MSGKNGKFNPNVENSDLDQAQTSHYYQNVQNIQGDIASTLSKNLENKENSEISQKLKDYCQAWQEKIYNINDDTKESILKVAEKIKVNVETESDGSRLIEFKLGGKKWKILDFRLNNSDQLDNVRLKGIRGDNVDDGENRKLADYVKQRQQEGFNIPKLEDFNKLLSMLGKEVDLECNDDRIAMLMYLTGMN